MLIWGTPPVIARAMSIGVPAGALAFSRWFIASLVLLPFVWRKMPKEWPKWRENWKSLVPLALFMVAGSSLSTFSVYFTTATNAVLVNASQPAITALVLWLVAGDKLRGRQGLGIACAFVGILVMICRADWRVLVGLDINIGDLIMLSAVIGWSLYAVFVHRREYAPSPDVLLFLIALVGTIVLLPIVLVEHAIVGGFEPRPEYLTAMVYLALFPTLLATYFWNLAIGSLGPNRAAIFINLIPLFGAIFARFFLDEALYPYHIIGAVFVFVGIYLAARRS
jgi:drug/metabolite transporter (DMT)-like permease